MREILFRAKRRVDYGDPTEWQFGVPFKDDDGDWIMKDGCAERVIQNDTLGQFTGLTDKNGVKIFEGDILQGDEYPYCSDGDYNYYAEVVWFDNGCCGFGLCTYKNPKSAVCGISDGNCEWFEDFNSDNWEVIGNIYDNPELIGDSENDT